MTNVLRVPLVVYGYLGDRLRRLPVAGRLLRHSTRVGGILIAGAFVAFVIWGTTNAPQRVSLTDLASGNLSASQSWIIISGDLSVGTARSSAYLYVLTDPAVPNLRLEVLSDAELPVGFTTVSGTYTGERGPLPLDRAWVGQMRADAMVAADLGPPWISLVLLTVALLLVAAARVSYPMFFGQTAHKAALESGTMQVGVRRGPLPTAGQVVPGTLVLRAGVPAELRLSDADTETLRLHSVHTAAEPGEMRRLTSSEPALRLRLAPEELTLTFVSEEQRDVAVATLRADAEDWTQAAERRPNGPAHGELR